MRRLRDMPHATIKAMTTKDELLHLVDELDEDAQAELLDSALWLAQPEDTLSPDELAGVEAGQNRDRPGRLRHARGPAPQAWLLSFEVRLSRTAARYLERLPRNAQKRIVDRLDQIAADPFGFVHQAGRGTA